ncbi:WD40 repeat domain-containing serine/threonine protein kinase [Saccharopolyspora kobensis]|uniref:WD40 repeat domain-containing serine/threonine protein kinase n=1 Tax=Saccharopolyspora kobensis TaxID=146035 RepID=UPI000D3B3B6D|nr:serine/threonine-protein kinase [Saccharopolyspora kobensis]
MAPSTPREIGQHRMLAELGRGGMGRVLLGSGPDGRLVALKLVHEQFAEEPGFRARFRREVEASQTVSGAYTAAVIDADPDAPTPWLASVFVPGPSLHEVITTTGTLPEQPALRLAAGLATALTHIHRVDLVHRDLKPANVLLTDDGPRVIDFGIVRAISGDRTSELTRTGWLIGSPGFMSPEQASGDPVTPASDVFSLGVVIVAACIGDSPFADSSTLRTLNNVVRAEADLTEVPPPVRRIVEPCLDREPANRPTPAEVLESIGPITPSAQPWPTAVHELIARRQADVAELLQESPRTRTTHQAGPPTVVETRLDNDPEPSPPTRSRALRTAALVVAVALIGVLAWALGPVLRKPTTEFQQVGAMSGDGSPWTAEFSPDGSTLAVAYTNGTLQLWDVDSQQPTSQSIVAFADLGDLSFSPDGRTLTTAGVETIESGDTTSARWIVQQWDVASGNQIGAPFTVEAHPDDNSSESIDPPELLADGRALAVKSDADSGSYVQLWDVASRRPIAPFDGGWRSGFSPDGRILAVPSTSSDGIVTLQLWDVASQQRIGNPISFPQGEDLEGFAFSSGGDLLVTTGYRNTPNDSLADAGTMRFWNPAGQNQVRQPIILPELRLDSLTLSPDGNHLAGFSGSDDTLELWNTDTGKKIDTLSDVRDAAFSPDGSTLVTVGRENDTVRMWLVPGS